MDRHDLLNAEPHPEGNPEGIARGLWSGLVWSALVCSGLEERT
jgi:hypothetical protein